MGRLLAALLLVALVFLLPIHAQDGRSLPDEEAFFAETRANMARAQQEQYRYAYKERRTELHMNPFGRVGTGGTRVFEVMPGTDRSVFYRRLLERDGTPVPDSPLERQERRSRPEGRSPVEDAVSVLTFAIDRRERISGRDAIVVRFAPKPDSSPETREGRLAKQFKGFIWVDETAREVMRAEATAIDDLSYGFGIVARLEEGTSVTLTRARVDDHLWLPTSIRFTGHGRAMLFRKLTVDHTIEWFDYKRVID